jgi:hypothetical protein
MLILHHQRQIQFCLFKKGMATMWGAHIFY